MTNYVDINKRTISEIWSNPDLINHATLYDYNDRLREICLNMFEWKNLPDYMDERYIEKTLYDKGSILFFKGIRNIKGVDIEAFFSLPCTFTGGFTIYEIPILRQAYSVNGYFAERGIDDSVIIWNNRNHKPTFPTIRMYATRLANVERTLDTNVKMLKNPLIASVDEKQKLTMANLFDKYNGNEPYIMVNRDNMNLNDLKTSLFPVNTPNNVNDLIQYKHTLWNEVLTFLGYSNVTFKRERMISDEVNAQNEQLLQERYNMLNERREACRQINKMFGLNISVDFKVDGKNTTNNDEIEVSDTNVNPNINNQVVSPRGEIYGNLYP